MALLYDPECLWKHYALSTPRSAYRTAHPTRSCSCRQSQTCSYKVVITPAYLRQVVARPALVAHNERWVDIVPSFPDPVRAVRELSAIAIQLRSAKLPKWQLALGRRLPCDMERYT